MFKYLTITRKPKKTSIWHTFIEKKTHFHPQTTSGPPICFGAGWTSLGRWLKNNGGPLVLWGWKWGFFSFNVCQMDVFFGFRVMVKHLITLKNFFTTSKVQCTISLFYRPIIQVVVASTMYRICCAIINNSYKTEYRMQFWNPHSI